MDAKQQMAVIKNICRAHLAVECRAHLAEEVKAIFSIAFMI